ncbi:MAG: response regulator [Rhodanobacter sp.]|nr:MAG: response regulator [Rhodanobacter sp.]TAL88987.1 MAG: response regulator [Rhodanobacter sp.]TAM40399.1 MAG: response regulator [Rhodanobacter sp.]TAN23224.1 MAG: response regulator [Rhodanobacter sp.]
MAIPSRVVVFEDDFLLAETLSDALTALGCAVVHCCHSLREAMLVVEKADFDLAVVDLDLRGLDASPILDRLVAGNIPALLSTGANEKDVPERFTQLPRLTKPYDQKQLKKAIEQTQISWPGSLRVARVP